MAAIGAPAQRPAAAQPPARTPVGRRRLVVGVLVVLSLALLSVYFRESDSGPVHSLQSDAAAALRPFEVAADRVAQPFRDASSWLGAIFHAKAENRRLKAENEQLRQQVILSEQAMRENRTLRSLIAYRDGPRFPADYDSVVARVIARSPSEFDQTIVVTAGRSSGIRRHDAVVTSDGLVGEVTKVMQNVSQVTLLTDETSAVSAIDIRSNATGIVRHGSSGASLILDRVTKDQVVNRGDVISTSGWKVGELSSIYPRGIAIGVVTSVGQADTDLYKQIQIEPFVDYASLETVLVLMPKQRGG